MPAEPVFPEMGLPEPVSLEVGPVPLSYEFLAPQRIVFGWGRRTEIGRLARGLGSRALLVHGSHTLAAAGVVVAIVESLAKEGIACAQLAAGREEPSIESVDAAVRHVRSEREAPDFVIGLGGGSALDLAKALAALLPQPDFATVRDYLEGVGRGFVLSAAPLPLLAMPTTGGTGSEATKNAVISCPDPPVKKSLRADGMLPCVVLVDPELAVSLPALVTAWTGLDAITQLIESYISSRARPIPQALAVEGLRRALPALPVAVANGSSRPAREAMAHAALLSGMALANSGLGFAHGVAAALGAQINIAHGLACAVMLPVALRLNQQVAERALAELARQSLGVQESDDARTAEALVVHIEQLCRQVGVPARLRELGVEQSTLPELAAGSRGNSMDGNPRRLSDADILAALEECW